MGKLQCGRSQRVIGYFIICLCILAFAGIAEAVEVKILGVEEGHEYRPCEFPEMIGQVTTGENETVNASLRFFLDRIEIFDLWANLGPNSSSSIPFSMHMTPFELFQFFAPGEHTIRMELGFSIDSPSTSVTYTMTPLTITLKGEYEQNVCNPGLPPDIEVEFCAPDDVGLWYNVELWLNSIRISTSLQAGRFDYSDVAPPSFLGHISENPGEYNIAIKILGYTNSWNQYIQFTEPYLSALDIKTVNSCGEQVSIDIKPGSCINPLNVKSKGVLPVAIFGTNELDVNDIDIATIRLSGVAAIRSGLEDIGIPFAADDCNFLDPDGIMDLTLKFSTRDIAAALGTVTDGAEVPLILTGTLKDGTVLSGEDTVMILKKGKNKGK